MASLTALLASEASLLQEAALALPHTFDKCTHSLGPLRQAVHLCLTCAVPRGLCSACSVACHGDHEQIELFPKRAFLCDCPTRVGNKDCTLYRGVVADNSGNKYGQNFQAKFCRCHRPYDPKCERETMVQCLLCEDWFHESCLNLRTRPTEQRPSPDPPTVAEKDDAEIDSTISNDLPLPLLPSSAYETLICGACVISNKTLQRWAGTKGFMMVVRGEEMGIAKQVEDGGIDPRWKVLDGSADNPEDLDVVLEGRERKHSLAKDEQNAVDEGRSAKRPRTDDGSNLPLGEPVPKDTQILSPCFAPPPNPVAQRVLNNFRHSRSLTQSGLQPDTLGEGDIFLAERWRDRWCRCPKCSPDLELHSYLLEEEETYEPPKDPDSSLSLEELGMRALHNMPRDRAIDGIRAYNAMRDELMAYLRPFAEEGRVVREEDVREFFERKTQIRGQGSAF